MYAFRASGGQIRVLKKSYPASAMNPFTKSTVKIKKIKKAQVNVPAYSWDIHQRR
jgi:hypothetical protein